MKLQVLSVKNPRWCDAAQTGVDLDVTLSGVGELPFTARPSDPEPGGRRLYEDAVAGAFGEVAPYEAPVQ